MSFMLKHAGLYMQTVCVTRSVLIKIHIYLEQVIQGQPMERKIKRHFLK